LKHAAMRIHLPIAITREGIAYFFILAFVTVGALLRDINLLALLAAMMSGPFLLSFLFAARSLGKLSIERTAPESVSVGELVVVRLALSSGRRRAARFVAVEDCIQLKTPKGAATTMTGRALFPCVPGGEQRRATYSGRFDRRGLYRVGPLRLSCAFPLGLARRTRVAAEATTLLVGPKLGRLTAAWHALLRRSFVGARRAGRPSPSGSEFRGLREWRQGDSRRAIHWRTTARRGALVARDFEEESSEQICLVVDLWLPADANETDRANIENIVSFAATIVAEQCRGGGGRTALAVSGRRPFEIVGPGSRTLLKQAIEGLALAEASREADAADALRRARSVARSDMQTIVLSPRDSAAAADEVRGATWIKIDAAVLSRFFHCERAAPEC
jgi:uncharacterized protein (DUF58 family)